MSRDRESSEDQSMVDKITAGEPLMALAMQTFAPITMRKKRSLQRK